MIFFKVKNVIIKVYKYGNVKIIMIVVKYVQTKNLLDGQIIVLNK